MNLLSGGHVGHDAIPRVQQWIPPTTIVTIIVIIIVTIIVTITIVTIIVTIIVIINMTPSHLLLLLLLYFHAL